LVGAAVRGLGRERVAATPKHFPGLGAAGQNTDNAGVTIQATRSELEGRDLGPFRAAVKADAPLVMVSHALYPAFDRTHIASQSKTLIGHVLRDDLGFRGVVVTDSIEAKAVLGRTGVAEAAERSVVAGADLILMTGSASWKLVYPRLLRKARRSPAFRARVRESAARVLRLKRLLGLSEP
jgi:beta-N-acetylhexosaminidase